MTKNSQRTESDDLLVKEIENTGLSRDESVIYLHSLKLGTETSASKIALATHIYRQYVYLILEKLIQFGLVIRIEKGARHMYKAMPPSAVERMARQKFERATKTAKQLAEISTLGHEQDFEIYVGSKQVRDFEDAFTDTLKEDESQFVISGASQNFFSFFKDEYDDLANIWREQRLRTFYIGGTHEQETLVYARKRNPYFEYRLLPGMPNGVTSTVVRYNNVVLYSLANPPLIYVIKSQKISAEYKNYFDMLWNLAK